jgi:hypothetical protein
MTWVKLSDDFGDRAAQAGLSDAAFRTHIEALLWTMRRETGGWIRERDIRRFAETRDPIAAVGLLVLNGWWHRPAFDERYPHYDADDHADLFRIVANMDDQPEPDVIEARRRRTAARVRRHRRKMAGLDPDEPDDPSNGVTERVTRDGTGRDGTGSPKTVGRGLRAVPPISSPNGSGPHDPTPPQTRKRVHDGTDTSSSDVQNFPTDMQPETNLADRNAREDPP